MANAWKTNSISFHGTNVLEEGKTHDLMPARLDDTEQQPNDAPKERTMADIKPLLPPWIPPSDEALKWEHRREKELLKLRENSTYQFVMLVTSFTNEKMDRYWVSPSEAQAEHSGVKDVGMVNAPVCSRRADRNDDSVKFHNYYVDTPWLDGIIYLSPAMYGHIEEAFVTVTQTHTHLSDVKLRHFVNTPRIRTMFGKLVALCIRASDFLSQKRYNLDNTYRRINLERMRLMNYWKHVQMRDGVLMYFHQRNGTQITYPTSGNPFQLRGGIEDDMFTESIKLGKKPNYGY